MSETKRGSAELAAKYLAAAVERRSPPGHFDRAEVATDPITGETVLLAWFHVWPTGRTVALYGFSLPEKWRNYKVEGRVHRSPAR